MTHVCCCCLRTLRTVAHLDICADCYAEIQDLPAAERRAICLEVSRRTHEAATRRQLSELLDQATELVATARGARAPFGPPSRS